MTLQSEMTPKLQTHSTWFLLLLYFHALLQNSTSLNFVQLRFLEEVLLNAIASLKWSDVKERCEYRGVEDVFCSPPSLILFDMSFPPFALFFLRFFSCLLFIRCALPFGWNKLTPKSCSLMILTLLLFATASIHRKTYICQRTS